MSVRVVCGLPWEETGRLKTKYGLRPIGGGLFVTSDPVPGGVKQFVAQDFSYARWVEDGLNKKVRKPRAGSTVFKLRDYQRDTAVAIVKAYDSGWSGFLNSSGTGTGKTLANLAGVTALAKRDGGRKQLLIVCPKGAIPVWRQTISCFPATHKYMRIMIINYEQWSKLLDKPKKSNRKTVRAKNREHAVKGKGKFDWDYIIFDEAHKLKNYPKSTVSLAAVNIAGLNRTYVKNRTPFVIFATATPGSTPLNFAVMSNFMSRLISGSTRGVSPSGWGNFLIQQGFNVTRRKNNYYWSDDKREQRRDTVRIGRALKRRNAPFVRLRPTDIAGWPEQQVIPLPLELSGEQEALYVKAWTAFKRWLKLTPAYSDPRGVLAQRLRYSQKVSLLKADSAIDSIADWVEQGYQVYVTVRFMESLDRLVEGLRKRRIKVSEYSGRNKNVRESERIKFQKGQTKVIVSTVVEAVSFHANEILPDGSRATNNERVTLVLDVRENIVDAQQSLGRAHRSGENSVAYIPFFMDTVDEDIVSSFVNKQTNMSTMSGDEDATRVEKIFREALSKH